LGKPTISTLPALPFLSGGFKPVGSFDASLFYGYSDDVKPLVKVELSVKGKADVRAFCTLQSIAQA
jgi:hypothetical protein